MKAFQNCAWLVIALTLISRSSAVNGSNDTESTVHLCDINPDMINAAYGGFLIAVIIVNVAGNGLVVVVIALSRALHNQTTNLFLCSLAVTDILVGLISLPIKIKQSFHNQLFCMQVGFCWFYFFTDTTFSIASVTHLFIIACDRFIAVKHTYIYDTVMSRKRVYFVIACVWIYSVAWSSLNIVNWSDSGKYGVEWKQNPPICSTSNELYFTTLYVVLFLIPILTMVLMYSYVYKQAVRHIRAISACEVRDSTSEKVNRRRKREFKALRAIVIVFIAFCMCWLPNIGVSLSGFWNINYWQNLYIRNRTAFIATFFICGQVLPPLNSTLNPFIYVVFNNQFRLAFRALILRFLGSENEFRNVDRRMTFFSERGLKHRMSAIDIPDYSLQPCIAVTTCPSGLLSSSDFNLATASYQTSLNGQSWEECREKLQVPCFDSMALNCETIQLSPTIFVTDNTEEEL